MSANRRSPLPVPARSALLRHGRRSRVSTHPVAGVAARVLIGLGVVVFLFVAYQLWATGLMTARRQASLRSQFDRTLGRRAFAPHAAQPSSTAVPPTATSSPLPVAGGAKAPPIGAPVGVIDIPSIGVNYVVQQGVGGAQLRSGPGHYPATPLPGQAGNAAIAGHRTTYAHPFYNLGALVRGDKVKVTTGQGRFVYRVERTLVVAPSDVAVLDPTSTPQLTLTTCTPAFSAAHRMVVEASLVSAIPNAARPTAAQASPTPHRPHTAVSELAGSQGDWVPAAGWGGIFVAAVAAAWLAVRRLRPHRRPWPAYVGGGAVLLVVLWFFFGAVGPLLPAGF